MTLHSAVIDRYSMRAFMSIAHAEGLLSAKRETDGVYEQICKTPVDYRIREQLLEQLVLTPTLAFNHCDEFLWDSLDGPLKNEGNIINLIDPKPEFVPQAKTISLDIIAGLVRAAGHNISTSEINVITDAALAAVKEQDEYVRQSGKAAPDLFKKQIIDKIIKKLKEPNSEIPDEYTRDEYEAQQRRNEKYKAYAPISEVFDEYLSAAQLAAKHNMLLKTPQFSDAGQTQIVNPNFVVGPASEELVLFRIVATQLGKMTYRPTIKGSLELAREPATVALREQLRLWQTQLPRGKESQLKAIQKEIAQSQKAISRLSGVETIGTIATWLSVPIGLTEFILALAPVLSTTIGVVGNVSSALDMATTRKYKWAMFGKI